MVGLCMNEFLLKDNEIMIFTDFNNTLVDFENEYNYLDSRFDEESHLATRVIKNNLSRCLRDFEKETGFTPVICVVTNASAYNIDSNGYTGITQDMRMTFFDHSNQTPERAKEVYDASCEKYFRYLLYKENDCFFKINPLAGSIYEMFEVMPFDESAKSIRYVKQFKKKESVDRIMSLVDPDKTRSKFIIFAGDSISDDYPMKLIETPEGVCKIFIRPGKVQKMKPSVMQEFCLAQGLVFDSVHPRTGKAIKCIDSNNFEFLSEKDKKQLLNYANGDHVLLTNRNSRGFVEGIYQAIDIIKSVKDKQTKQLGE